MAERADRVSDVSDDAVERVFEDSWAVPYDGLAAAQVRFLPRDLRDPVAQGCRGRSRESLLAKDDSVHVLAERVRRLGFANCLVFAGVNVSAGQS